MLRKRVPLYAVAAAWAAGSIGALVVMGHGEAPPPRTAQVPSSPKPQCEYVIRRVAATGHVRPFLSAEPDCESPRYAAAKARVAQAIDAAKREGAAEAVGVYVRDFDRSEWFAIDGDRPFDPGSLLKLPVAMAVLRMAEADPAMLQRPAKLRQPVRLPAQHFPPEAPIHTDSAYTMATLLERAIEQSDNVANTILAQHMDFGLFRDLLRQLGLPDMPGEVDRYPLSAAQAARFFKAIYNSSFIGPRTAEYAMQRLLRTRFSLGMRAGVPQGTEVASKFGEAGAEAAWQLHEGGLVFAPGGTYLAVVMTRGPRMEALPGVVARVHAAIHAGMQDAAAPAKRPA